MVLCNIRKNIETDETVSVYTLPARNKETHLKTNKNRFNLEVEADALNKLKQSVFS